MNFIVCEDEPVLAKHYKNIIDNFMMNYDLEYDYYEFDGYGVEFKKIAEKDLGHKIYILDVKTKEGSGINTARMIREEYNDWVSMIIIITSFPEYKYEIIGKRLMLLDFVSKLDKPEKRLVEDLKICMQNFGTKFNSLRFKYKGIVQVVDLSEIIYIEKEQDSKRCIIHTTNKNYYILGTLNEFYKKVDKRFIKSHRSLIVNINQIDYFDSKNNQLFFKNKESTFLISRDKKKEMINCAKFIY